MALLVRCVSLVMLVALVGCKRSRPVDPQLAALELPLFTAFEMQGGTLRFDPKTASEQQIVEQLSQQLAERGWLRLTLEKESTRATFGKPGDARIVEAYTGYGVLELSMREKWPSDETLLAAAQKTPAEKTAELESLRTQLLRAAARLPEARGLDKHKCPDERVAALVTPGFLPGQVLYVSPSVTDPALVTLARDTVGAHPVARGLGDDVDAEWRAALPVLKAGLVIFVEPTMGSQARTKNKQTFAGGNASIRYVVSERETGAPLCVGSFFAASSGEVWAREGRADLAVAADLSRNATESFRQSLAALSKSLAFEKVFP